MRSLQRRGASADLEPQLKQPNPSNHRLQTLTQFLPTTVKLKPKKKRFEAALGVAIAGFVVAGGMGGLWLDAQDTAKAEIAELKDTIRSMKRAENKQTNQDSSLVADNEALQQQISALQQQNNQLSDENEALKNREAERAQRAISASTKTESATPAASPSHKWRWKPHLHHPARPVAFGSSTSRATRAKRLRMSA